MPEADTLPLDRLKLLTPKERECLRLVLENRSSKQIARQLGISQTSVDTHVRRARDKLGIRDRYAAARLLEAWERGAVAAASPAAGPELMPVAVDPSGLRMPPLSSLNIFQRLALVVAGAIIAALVFGVLLTALSAL
jgi:DNA-binding CsgD family transcriptional regulator